MFEEFQESGLKTVFNRCRFPQHRPEQPAQSGLMSGEKRHQAGVVTGLGRILVQTGASLSSAVKMREPVSLFEGKQKKESLRREYPRFKGAKTPNRLRMVAFSVIMSGRKTRERSPVTS